MHKTRSAFFISSLAAALLAGCDDGPILPQEVTPTPDPGALIAMSLDGTVGVLLDELPAAIRPRVADSIESKPESFWRARAVEQFRLSSLRLNFRQFEYDAKENKLQLPIPPEQMLNFKFSDAGPNRRTIDGHDMVAIDYHFSGVIVTTADAPGASEPMLADVGGTWDEPFVMPADPTLLLERTGYACMNEAGYPPDSVETENAYLFYDDNCKVETPKAAFCHLTMPQPPETCVDTLQKSIGRVSSAFHYERIAWDDAIAAANKVGEVTQTDYPDLAVRADFLDNNYIVYRYFAKDNCAIEEKCIGGPGWRRLLMFDSVDHNVGGKPLTIGKVDYYLAGGDTDNALHGMYEYSACHKHYHFMHYGQFDLVGDGLKAPTGRKAGFCLQSTDRLSNNELGPIDNPYGDCSYQGVEVGWGDKYQAGLPCQWLDITDSGVKGAPVDATLSFHSNPDGFLCEGTPVLDDKGNQVWEPTSFTTAAGKPVDRPKCDFFDGSDANDMGQTNVSIPEKGGLMTGPCQKHQIGPLRNCEFTAKDDSTTCSPGAKVTLKCTVADPSRPQVVRICDYSFALGQGSACSAYEARATKVIDGAEVPVEFTCPEKRDDVEKGGRYALYTGAAYNPDGDVDVNCVAE